MFLQFQYFIIIKTLLRVYLYPIACLRNAFCKMYITICGRFRLNEGGVAGYGNRMKAKYTVNWGVQIAGMIFQTRSSTLKEVEGNGFILKRSMCRHTNFILVFDSVMHFSGMQHIPFSPHINQICTIISHGACILNTATPLSTTSMP